jgi:hypothetical protein
MDWPFEALAPRLLGWSTDYRNEEATMNAATQPRIGYAVESRDAGPRELSPAIAWLATLMDDAYQIPGTQYRVGLDGLLGLIPGIGDLATLVIGGLVLQEARRLGVSRWTQARMLANYALDFSVGLIPLAGDVFDVAFKAHRKNVRLLQQHVQNQAGKVDVS